MDMLKQRIKELEAKHGGLRPMSRVLQLDPAYLLRLKNGDKNNPSAKVLKKLGLKKVIQYVDTLQPKTDME